MLNIASTEQTALSPPYRHSHMAGDAICSVATRQPYTVHLELTLPTVLVAQLLAGMLASSTQLLAWLRTLGRFVLQVISMAPAGAGMAAR